MHRCLFGLTMVEDDTSGDAPVMTYSAFIYILQKTAADDATFRASFESDPEGTMHAAGHEFDLSKYDYSSQIELPTAQEAQDILQAYLADYETDQRAGMGGSQRVGDSIDTRITDP